MSRSARKHFNTVNGGIHFGVVIQGRHVELTLPRQLPLAQAGLPRRAPGFTGRKEDLRELLRGLASTAGAPGREPVLALAGMAGVGKTALAVHTAHQAHKKGWFPGGVLFIDLNGQHGDPNQRLTPARALSTLLRSLGMPPEHLVGDTDFLGMLWRSVLSKYVDEGQRLLVLLDNAYSEQQVEPLLPSDSGTAVLVTSRSSLDIGARMHDVPTLDDSAGTQMLNELLLRAHPDDTRIADDPEQAERIAALCAGLPLALRITGARLTDSPSRPLSSLADSLDDRRSRLARLRRGDEEHDAYRDQAVRAAFDLSYDNLTAGQSRLFRLLSLHSGPQFSLEAVTHLSDTDAHTTGELLWDLERAHLLVPVPQAPEAAAERWQMHDLLRLYAEECGEAEARADHRDTAANRLLDHYLDTARAAVTHLHGPSGERPSERFPDHGQARAWLDAERTNLVAAARVTAPRTGHRARTDLALVLAAFFERHRYFDDWIALTEAAVDVFHGNGDREREGDALNNLGNALYKAGRFDESVRALERALDIRREQEDQSGEGMTLDNLGNVLREKGRLTEAVDAHRSAVAISRKQKDRPGLGKALNNLGNVLVDLRRFDEAVKAYSADLEICRDLEDRHGEGTTLINLGNALREKRHFAEAVADLGEAATIFDELDDGHHQATALDSLGCALREKGDLAEAVTTHKRAVDIFHELDEQGPEADALSNLGAALRRTHDYAEALTVLDRAVGIDPACAAAIGERAETYRVTGRHQEALTEFDRAISIKPDHSWAMARRGETYRFMGRHKEALAEFNRAIEMAPDDAWAIASRARVHRIEGDLDSALTDLDRALDITQDSAWIFVERGQAHHLDGRPQDAVADLERALELAPQFGQRLRPFIRTLRDSGR